MRKIAASSLSVNNLQGNIEGGAITAIDYDLAPNKVVTSEFAGKASTPSLSNIK